MNNYLLISIIIFYLAILFFIAYIAESRSRSKWVNNPYVYSLSLGVYCSAWTYYGSVGIAANSGLSFLPIYLGPIIASPLWIVLLRKIIRISKQHKISSIADFISLRYGNNRFLGALVALVCVIGILPYIALQLKAVSETFEIMADETSYVSTSILDDSTFYIAVLLALFATFFGTQTQDASEKHKGIVMSVAIESVTKLLFFLIIGIYVTFYLFDGTSDIHDKISVTEGFSSLTRIKGLEGGLNWMFTIMLSFIAIFLLPRQFQVSVLENNREKYLKKAIWMFPLYLLLFNIFVVFIAWGGKLTFGDAVNPDYYSLLLPLKKGNVFLASLVFLGGFSAVISMVVVSTLALSVMVSNNLIIPYGFLDKFSKGHPEKNSTYIKSIRRVSIFSIIIIAYAFYYNFSIELSLVSIGLMAFLIIAQLAPSFFIGLFWNRGSSKAAIISIIVGFLVTAYTLILPFSIQAITGSTYFIDNGLFGISLLRPYSLFGIDFLTPVNHAFFWSLSLNTLCYMIFSLTSKGNYRERNYAEMFVDSSNYTTLQDGALVWKGEAFVADIRNVLNRFLGEKRTERALNIFFEKYRLPKDSIMADARLINFSEKLLTGSIGSASAKILISGVVKEEQISLVEVLKILEESKDTIATNKHLREKSKQLTDLTDQLKQANINLIDKDKQKDEFLDTVAHELKTPITGIRAATELLIDENEDMPAEVRAQFLNNMLQDSERLSRLIHNILDFEKLARGKSTMDVKLQDIQKSIKKSLTIVSNLAQKKGVEIINKNPHKFSVVHDEDRLVQVLTNLLSNAIKFSPEVGGKIVIDYKLLNSYIELSVTDNGNGIPEEDITFIFDKFYQSKDQNTRKPEGSGLGLSISKEIIEQHKGRIWVDKDYKKGAKLAFILPFE